jgi:broad specificity phosphatase PhoE
MTTFWWVRHGPTHQKALTGWRDAPADLSDRAALDRLAVYLPRDALVISSDLRRSVATADAIQRGRRRLPHDADLREFHFGEWDGKHFTEVAARDPQLSRAYWEDPGHHAPPGGESWFQAEARVARAVARLPEARDIVVVAHFGVILAQLRLALGLSPAEVLAQKIDNLSVTRIAGGDVGPINHVV